MADMFALVDPNWGEPMIVSQTIRETEDGAWSAAISPKHCPDTRLYSGASEHPYPHGTPGKIETLQSYGFTVQPVTVTINSTNGEGE